MKLRFLGQTYSLSQQQILTTPSENIACFRGQKYNLPVPVTTPSERSRPTELTAVVQKYRGVSYVVERHQFIEQPNNQRNTNIAINNC